MSELADVAAALADRTRARMLEELLGGPPLSAGALAVRVGVAPSTVSGHLRKLERAGLIAIESHGRRREARLAGPQVAEALEALANLGPPDADRPIGLTAHNKKQALREARSCYDHLAGRAGVALADQLLEHGALELRDGAFVVADAALLRRPLRLRPRRRSAPAARSSARASTGPSAARTSPARSGRRCWTRCCGRRSSGAAPTTAR